MSEPIFKNLAQALYVSFAVEGMPESNISPTRLVIDAIKRKCGYSFDAPEKTVNMGTLNRLEIRGQYSMIRAVVKDHLVAPEKHAIWARYGQVNAEYKVFTKVEGVEGIAKYVEDESLVSGDAFLALCANFYHLEDEKIKYMTMQQILNEYSIEITKLARAKRVIGKYSADLESKAFENLYDVFNKEQVVKEFEKTY